MDTMKQLANFACAFALKFEVRFVYALTKPINDDILTLGFLHSKVHTTFRHFIHFAKQVVKEEELFLRSDRLGSKVKCF